jgi:hypothetical protein
MLPDIDPNVPWSLFCPIESEIDYIRITRFVVNRKKILSSLVVVNGSKVEK